VVAVFMPREPDLGLGRPDARSGVLKLASQALDCNACAITPSAFDNMKQAAMLSLMQVRADIRAAQQDRAALSTDFTKH
jgi:hypothetical protein